MRVDMRYLKIVLPLLLLLGVGTSAHAANYSIKGKVKEILLTRSGVGVCAVFMENFTAPGNCGPKWISLDCKGEFHGKQIGRSMLELAQIAKATDKQLRVWFNDSQRHNGRCTAFQVSLL